MSLDQIRWCSGFRNEEVSEEAPPIPPRASSANRRRPRRNVVDWVAVSSSSLLYLEHIDENFKSLEPVIHNDDASAVLSQSNKEEEVEVPLQSDLPKLINVYESDGCEFQELSLFVGMCTIVV